MVSPGPDIEMVVLLYRRTATPDDHVLAILEAALKGAGHEVFIDRHLRIGVEWAKMIESAIRSSDFVVPILSDNAVGSEMLQYELETAADEYRKRNAPMILPIRVGSLSPLEGAIGACVNGLQFANWNDAGDDERLVEEVLNVIAEVSSHKKSTNPERIESTGGAIPPSSGYYTLRASDAEFESAIRGNESVILVKGPRQIGKTSLIGRGVELVDRLGWRQVSTDFQLLSSFQLLHEDHVMRVLAEMLARQADFKYDFASEWLDVFGPTINLDNFLRALLQESELPLVWFMDEADRIFATPFSNDFFGVVRSWHNSRARDPKGPWGRFTVVIGYATEARLFIRDLNQSPFNVGRQITMKPFTVDQISDLNDKFGKPIQRRSDLESLHFVLAGQPFLIRRSLELLATGKIDYSNLMETADRDDGPFGDHLKRILISVSHTPSVLQAVRKSLAMQTSTDIDGIERLLAAGVLKETPDGHIDLACDLYTRYLSKHLGK